MDEIAYLIDSDEKKKKSNSVDIQAQKAASMMDKLSEIDLN